jgi:tetratricopeptide (TPR) repeat protein
MSSLNNEFDFIDDASGGRFISSGDAAQEFMALIRRNEIENAARMYEDLSPELIESVFEQLKTSSSGTRKLAAESMQRARDFGMAARLYELNASWAEAAASFEHAGNFERAGECFQKVNQLDRAAAAYERAGAVDRAIPLLQQLGDKSALAECFIRHERYFEAAQVYRQLRKTQEEVEMLRQVGGHDPNYTFATLRMAMLMEQFGHHERALGILMPLVRSSESGRRDPDVQQAVIRLLLVLNKPAEAEKARALFATVGAAPASVNRPLTSATGANPQALEADRGADAAAYAYLKAIPIFAELTLRDMKDLYRMATKAVFAASSALLEQGAPGKGLLVLVEGEVEVSAGGRLLNRLGAGAYLGEIGLVSEQPASATVTARTPVKALHITPDAFQKYIYEHPQAAIFIYRLFAKNLADRVRTLSATPAKG